ncbi:MAG: SUMF1/EgtB/PvdO family nonheme iron enzyme [Pirellulaceae bacterium]
MESPRKLVLAIFAFTLLGAAAGAVEPPPPPAEVRRPPNVGPPPVEPLAGRWALLIGVDDYTELEDLRFAGADMRALRERLIASGFPERQVFLMHDDADESHYRPIRENIEKQLKLVMGLAEQGDLVLVAFSGHGVHLDGKSYLCPTEADLNRPKETMVPVDTFYQQLRGAPADLKLMLVDACRDDPRPPGRRSAAPLPSKQEFNSTFERPPEGLVLLSSCRAGQVSVEDEEFGHGVFMHFVLRALEGKADGDGDGAVSLGELSRYSAGETKVYVARKFNEFQTPGLRGDLSIEALDFPLRAASAKPELTNSLGMKLNLIPAGEFRMGSEESPSATARAFGGKAEYFTDEHPRHNVRITRPFYLGAYEVTRGEFRQFMESSGYVVDSERDGQGAYGFNATTQKFEKHSSRYSWLTPGFQQSDRHPVVNVSWRDAVAFCEWLSEKEGRTYRLPTEAEWEYACRAGAGTRFQSGNDVEGLALVGNVADASARQRISGVNWAIRARDGYVFTAPVGSFRPNGFGVYDMHGNVWEWCLDRYGEDYYSTSPLENPSGPEESESRVIRGGGYYFKPANSRSAFRAGYSPSSRNNSGGFRVVMKP